MTRRSAPGYDVRVMLSFDEVMHFNTFGFVAQRQLFSPTEAQQLREELDAVLGADHPAFDDEAGVSSSHVCERGVDLLKSLPTDERIYDIPNKILGGDFVYEASDGSVNVGDTPWHGGGGVTQKPYASIKVSLYLEEHLTADNGCLRIILAAHRNLLEKRDKRWIGVPDYTFPVRNRQVHDDFRPWGLRPDEVPHLAMESRLGDALVFCEDLPHAAFNTGGGRRQIHLAFMQNPTSAHQGTYIKHRCAFGFGIFPPRSFVESDDPRLQRMVAPLVDLGIEPSDHPTLT